MPVVKNSPPGKSVMVRVRVKGSIRVMSMG